LTGCARGGIPGLLVRNSGGLGGGIGLRLSLNRAANFFSNIYRNGAGVRFLLRDTKAG
jgi:hypothetical protein